VADALGTRFTEENQQLPPSMLEADIRYLVIPTFTAEDRRDLQRSLEPAVRALQLFGGGAAAATIVVFLLGALRVAKRLEDDARTWLHLGATKSQRTLGVALPLAAAGAAGLTGSALLGWAASGLGPIASARPLEPAGRLGLSAPLLLVVLGASSALLAAGVLLAAVGVTRARPQLLTKPTSRPVQLIGRLARPSMALGVRAALTSAGARVSLAASVAAVAAVLATSVFTTSLSAFVSSPSRFGWPYDAAVIVGFGYGGADEAAIATTLDRPEVKSWGLASMSTDSAINGTPVPFVAGRRSFGDLPLPVIEGALPVADEIAVGALTAKRLGIGVGDRADVTTPYGNRQATVSGLVVLPSVGPFEADRVSLGVGALLSEQFLGAIFQEAERAGEMAPGTLAGPASSFVVIDLDDQTDSAKFLASIGDQLASWDVNGFKPFVYPEPVRPAPVADVASMRAVPVALTGVFALAMVIGLGLGIAAATRARRRELGILRALGCVGGQLRASVQWHALTIVAVGLAVGLPLGVSVGRVAYRKFAGGLGFFPEPLVSLPWTLLSIVAAVGLGLVAVAAPARRAARSTVTVALRYE